LWIASCEERCSDVFSVDTRTWHKCHSVSDAYHGDKYFTRRTTHVCCKMFARGQETVVDH